MVGYFDCITCVRAGTPSIFFGYGHVQGRSDTRGWLKGPCIHRLEGSGEKKKSTL